MLDDLFSEYVDIQTQMKELRERQKELKHQLIAEMANGQDYYTDNFVGNAKEYNGSRTLDTKQLSILLAQRFGNEAVDVIQDAYKQNASYVKLNIKSLNTSNYKSHKKRLFELQNGICNGCHNPYTLKRFYSRSYQT